MENILSKLSEPTLIKAALRANWENYHYCLGQAQHAELSVGRYLNWLMTDLPDHFMNLVVCTRLPSQGTADLVQNALTHFRSLRVQKLSWLVRAGARSIDLNTALLTNGLTFRESFATEMAMDLSGLSDDWPVYPGLNIVQVEDDAALRKWIRVASREFRIPEVFEPIWHDLFADTIFRPHYRTYLGLLDGKPVGTSQLFFSEGVAGIYNVTVVPEVRRHGIGSALTLIPLQAARKLGYRIGILQASRQGYSVYRRLGFRDLGQLGVYLWDKDRASEN